jgi:hypothetical protein
MTSLWNPSEHSFEENKRWAWLRAIEWKAWPGFVSQPFIPVLFAFLPFYEVIIGLIMINCLWIALRWRLINISWASVGAIVVVFAKWPICILMTVYFVVKGAYLLALLSITWPFLSGLISFPCAVGYGIGVYELRFLEKMGYKDIKPALEEFKQY